MQHSHPSSIDPSSGYQASMSANLASISAGMPVDPRLALRDTSSSFAGGGAPSNPELDMELFDILHSASGIRASSDFLLSPLHPSTSEPHPDHTSRSSALPTFPTFPLSDPASSSAAAFPPTSPPPPIRSPPPPVFASSSAGVVSSIGPTFGPGMFSSSSSSSSNPSIVGSVSAAFYGSSSSSSSSSIPASSSRGLDPFASAFMGTSVAPVGYHPAHPPHQQRHHHHHHQQQHQRASWDSRTAPPPVGPASVGRISSSASLSSSVGPLAAAGAGAGRASSSSASTSAMRRSKAFPKSLDGMAPGSMSGGFSLSHSSIPRGGGGYPSAGGGGGDSSTGLSSSESEDEVVVPSGGGGARRKKRRGKRSEDESRKTPGLDEDEDKDDDDDDDDDDDGRVSSSLPTRMGIKREDDLLSSSFDPATGSYIDPVTGLRTSGGGGDKEEMRKLRLARKAELARLSRRRKKMYVADLETKVKKLTDKIQELQAKLAKAKQAASTGKKKVTVVSEEKERAIHQQRIRQELAQLVTLINQAQLQAQQASSSSSSSSAGIVPPGSAPSASSSAAAAATVRPPAITLPPQTQQHLQLVLSQFINNSRARQNALVTYLDRVQDCLAPGVQVKFLMWALDQNDDFYDNHKPGLWSALLCNELGLSEAQMDAIKAFRKPMAEARKALVECETTARILRERSIYHLSTIHHYLDQLVSVMTPVQLAKYCVWVDNNEWCMQMLNSMFQKPGAPPVSPGGGGGGGGVGAPSSAPTSPTSYAPVEPTI